MAMKLSPRQTLAGVAAALLLSAAAACSSSGSSSPSSTSSGSSTFGVNATGTVTFWARQATDSVAKAMVAQFNATHKNLKVVLHLTQPNEATTELGTAIRAGDVPDLVGLNDIKSSGSSVMPPRGWCIRASEHGSAGRCATGR